MLGSLLQSGMETLLMVPSKCGEQDGMEYG